MENDQPNGKILTLFSTASAVGKTFLAVNMAAGLAASGYKVCLIDLDLQFGDVAYYLHLKPRHNLFDLVTQLQKTAVPSDINLFDYLTPYIHDDLQFFTLLPPDKLEQACNIFTAGINRCLNELQTCFDYLIVDTTSAFSEINLSVMDMSTIIAFIGIVDFIPTIKNMKIGYDTMHSIGYDNQKIHLILNRSDSKTNIELNDVRQLLKDDFYHIIPNNFQQAQNSLRSGIPLLASDKSSDLGKSIRQLINKCTDQRPSPTKNDSSLHGWMKHLFN